MIGTASNEVFISYARSSEVQARRIAELLRSLGLSVWWDDDLPAHRSYGDVIEERLRAAKAVLVLWSADAAKSQWVRAEADAARNAGTLVQISLDGMMPPMPFNQIQCAALNNWDGDANAAGWSKIYDSVVELVGRTKAEATAEARPTGLSICVLPLANVSNDPDQEYFSDGITEDLILGLSQISALSVVARNTSFTFKCKPVEITALAAQLRVSHVVEGSVRKAGNRVRITAQLIDARTGHHLWGQQFDRELTDVFAIQDEISEAIVSQLRVKLLPGELGPPQHVPDARLIKRPSWHGIAGTAALRLRSTRRWRCSAKPSRTTRIMRAPTQGSLMPSCFWATTLMSSRRPPMRRRARRRKGIVD